MNLAPGQRSAQPGVASSQHASVASRRLIQLSPTRQWWVGALTSGAESKDFWRYNWDHENRLTNAAKRRERINYTYDALGRRVKTVNFLKGVTKYTYDGDDVIQDIDSNSGITKYQNGEGVDTKLRIENGSSVNYLLFDHLGSTSGLADPAGNLTSSASYDSFGNSTGNLATRYQFTGREKDSSTGLYYYRARWYNSKIGRFMSEDPIGFAGGDVNLFGYVGNDPQGFTDPSGLFPGNWGSVSDFIFGGNGIGNNFADWADSRIGVAEDFYGGDPIIGIGINFDLSSFSSRPFNTVGLFGTLRGIAGWGRVGNGVGAAIFCEDNVYGKLAFVAQDVERGAGLFTAMLIPMRGFASVNAAKGVGGGNAARVSEGILLPENLPKNINVGQQGKHLPGHNNFIPGRSRIAEGVNPQELLDGVHSGAHPIIRTTPNGRPVVDFGTTIGHFQGQGTRFGIVHYGKSGAHIIPANPIQY